MERKLARVEPILAIDPIPGADAIETATVGGWKVVVKKGQFTVGQKAVFFEIDSLLPRRPWNAFLFKPTDAKETYRLRTVRLRGQISQGLLVPITDIPELVQTNPPGIADPSLVARLWCEGDDVTTLLHIEKWEMPIPAQLAGQVKGNFPHFLRKTDEPRLQSAPNVLAELPGLPLYITIKCDGTSLTAYRHEGVFGVCSRNLDLKPDGGDEYWTVARAKGLDVKLPEGYAIQAELVGPGIQDNKMGLKEKTLFVFNIWSIPEQRYLDFVNAVAFVQNLGLDFVPVVATHKSDSLPTIVDEWLAYAEQITYPNGTPAEGIVVRPMTERYSPELDGRLSFKVISNRFLLKYGE